MIRNRNFIQNIYYSMFPEKVTWHYMDKPKVKEIKNDKISLIRNTITIVTYLTFIYTTNDYKLISHVISLII